MEPSREKSLAAHAVERDSSLAHHWVLRYAQTLRQACGRALRIKVSNSPCSLEAPVPLTAEELFGP